ncbi:MAG TPA: DMT family transporter [Kiloniellaceae bacterium]|nr:DMT family transporter [Kiloniellaceae bacterium]
MTAAPLPRDLAATARLGVALAVFSAVGYGTMITATRLAYDAGSNPLTLIVARAAVPGAILALIMLARRQSFALAPGAFRPVAGVALGQLGITIGYLGAVAYIPVSLAALVFYAYPVLVAGLLPLLGRGRVHWTAALAFLAAFAGLALALAPSFTTLDPIGLALALCATFSGTLLVLAADRLPPGQDMLAVGLYMNLAALAAVGPYALLAGGLAAPATAVGWGAIAYVCLGFLLAFLAMIGAVRHAGPLRTALVFNVEPLVAIASAVLLLGERLGAGQALGVGLVVAALVLATLAERLSPPPPPPSA